MTHKPSQNKFKTETNFKYMSHLFSRKRFIYNSQCKTTLLCFQTFALKSHFPIRGKHSFHWIPSIYKTATFRDTIKIKYNSTY